MEFGDDSSTVNTESVSLNDVMNALKEQNRNFEAIIDSKLSERIGVFREEFKASTSSVVSQVKKLKTDCSHKWTSEGNKIQFELNSDVLDELKQALWALDNDKAAYARELMSGSVEKLKQRNKHIKIADNSEAGWETVRQYQVNPVASDSDDESRITRAENRAIRKRKNKATKKTQSVKQHAVSHPSTAGFPSFGDSFRWPQLYGQQLTGYPVYQYAGGSRNTARGSQRGACFACGSFKHYRADCPINKQSNSFQKVE